MLKSDFMTNEEVLRELNSNSLLNEARKLFEQASAEMEQDAGQRKLPTIWEIRNKQFDLAVRMAALFGVKLVPGEAPSEHMAVG